ncbi:MAG: DUF3566 domain-containing protein [Acidimicrobiales bacterium]
MTEPIEVVPAPSPESPSDAAQPARSSAGPATSAGTKSGSGADSRGRGGKRRASRDGRTTTGTKRATAGEGADRADGPATTPASASASVAAGPATSGSSGSGSGSAVSGSPGRGGRHREVAVEELLEVVERPTAAESPSPGSGATLAIPRRAEVRAARRLQARKVGRLVRHIDLWSLLKVVLLFYLCLLMVGVVAGALVWRVLTRSGTIASVEGFVEQFFVLERFRFDGGLMFRIGLLGGLVGVLVLSLLTVVAGMLFNLISDLTGGVRLSVVELESARPVPHRSSR